MQRVQSDTLPSRALVVQNFKYDPYMTHSANMRRLAKAIKQDYAAHHNAYVFDMRNFGARLISTNNAGQET